VTTARRFIPVLLGAAAAILIHQLIDITSLLPGVDFSTSFGRVRQLLAIEARSPGILTADLLLVWAVVAGGHRRALRLTLTLHLVFGALLLLVVPWFLVDAGRVSGVFEGTESLAFRIVVARTLFMLALLGFGALLTGRALHNYLKELANPSS
jgi:hypothetical protein